MLNFQAAGTPQRGIFNYLGLNPGARRIFQPIKKCYTTGNIVKSLNNFKGLKNKPDLFFFSMCL